MFGSNAFLRKQVVIALRGQKEPRTAVWIHKRISQNSKKWKQPYRGNPSFVRMACLDLMDEGKLQPNLYGGFTLINNVNT